MNINALTLDEIIRTAEPETDLERRLLGFLTDARYVNLDEYECRKCRFNEGIEKELEDACANHNALQKDLAEFICQLKDAITVVESDS